MNFSIYKENAAASMIPRRPLISLVICFFNEEETIPELFKVLQPLFEKSPGYDFEVICVNDGSQDRTLSYLLEAQQILPRIKIIDLSRNFGKEAALSAGLAHAGGDAAVPMDADLQDPPELIPEMLRLWRLGYEVVLARRQDRDADRFLKRKSAEWFYRLMGYVSATKIPDNVGDFRLMDACVVRAVNSLPENQRFMKGLFAWVGFKTVTIDYTREKRVVGTSKFSGWRLWNFAIEGLTSFSTWPLRIWTYVGIMVAGLSFLYASYIVLRTALLGVDVPGYASLITIALFMGGLQLMGLGIIGEYLGRLYMESKHRPLYLVRRIYETDNQEKPDEPHASGERGAVNREDQR